MDFTLHSRKQPPTHNLLGCSLCPKLGIVLFVRRIDWFCKYLIFNDEKESSSRENTTRILAKTSIKRALTKKTYFA